MTSLPSWNGSYVTLAGPVGTNLVNVSAVDPETYGPPPSSYTLPDGLLSFTLEVPPARRPWCGSTTLRHHCGGVRQVPRQRVDAAAGCQRPVGPTEEWIDITLVDGGIGDDDGSPTAASSTRVGWRTSTATDRSSTAPTLQ